MCTIGGTIYWPLYSYKLIWNEMISDDFTEQKDRRVDIICPFLNNGSCRRNGDTNCKSLLDNNNCPYTQFHQKFLLRKDKLDDVKSANEEIMFQDGENYQTIYSPKSFNSKTHTQKILSLFPQPFKIEQLNSEKMLDNNKKKFKEKIFYDILNPANLTNINNSPAALYGKSEYLLNNNINFQNRTPPFYKLVNIYAIKNILPGETHTPEDKLALMRLSLFADGKIDALCSLLIKGNDAPKNKKLVSQALGSLNQVIYQQRLEFLERWCQNLGERVIEVFEEKMIEKGDEQNAQDISQEESLNFAVDAINMMMGCLEADSTKNNYDYIDKNNIANILTDTEQLTKLSNISVDRKQYVFDLYKKASQYVSESLENRRKGKLRGRFAHKAAHELYKIASHHNPNNSRLLIYGEAGGGKGVAASEFHRLCMEKIASNIMQDNKKYLSEIETNLKNIFDLPSIYTSTDSTDRILSFKSQVASTCWWKWIPKDFSEDNSCEYDEQCKLLKESIDAFKNIATEEKKIVTQFVDLIEKKILFEYSRKEKADWSFNFFQINCGILGGQNSELQNSLERMFGVKGDQEKALPGLFQTCSYVGGTLFFDEIADAPIRIQDNLLMPLEEGKVNRFGWETFHEEVKNIRIIGATFKNLDKLSIQYQDTLPSGNPKGFRPDLLTRLNRNTPVTIPPIWRYFTETEANQNLNNALEFAIVLKEAFGLEIEFWQEVFRVIDKTLLDYESISVTHIPDPVIRRRHFAKKINMRLLKNLAAIVKDAVKEAPLNKKEQTKQIKIQYVKKDFLPGILKHMFTDVH